jgi:histidine ammonia-lyase
VEEHAGFATQSARATSDAVAAYRAVLACELIAATRALRLQGLRPAGDDGLRAAYDLADSALDRSTEDRPLDGDLAAADGVLAALALVAPWPAAGR